MSEKNANEQRWLAERRYNLALESYCDSLRAVKKETTDENIQKAKEAFQMLEKAKLRVQILSFSATDNFTNEGLESMCEEIMDFLS